MVSRKRAGDTPCIAKSGEYDIRLLYVVTSYVSALRFSTDVTIDEV